MKTKSRIPTLRQRWFAVKVAIKTYREVVAAFQRYDLVRLSAWRRELMDKKREENEMKFKGFNNTIIGSFEGMKGTIEDFQEAVNDLGRQVPEMAGHIVDEQFQRGLDRYVLILRGYPHDEIAEEIK